MTKAIFACSTAILLLAIAAPGLTTPAWAQATARRRQLPAASKTGSAPQADPELQAIDDKYNRELLQLDQRRLESLGLLAASQKPDRAAITYERLFRLAIAGNLFRDAEGAAGKVIEQGTPAPTTLALAHLVKIVALADRGAADESLRSLRRAVAESTRDRPATESRAGPCPC